MKHVKLFENYNTKNNINEGFGYSDTELNNEFDRITQMIEHVKTSLPGIIKDIEDAGEVISYYSFSIISPNNNKDHQIYLNIYFDWKQTGKWDAYHKDEDGTRKISADLANALADKYKFDRGMYQNVGDQISLDLSK